LFPKHGYYFWPNKCCWTHAVFRTNFDCTHAIEDESFSFWKWPFYSPLPISVLKCWTYPTFVVAVLFSVLRDQCDGFYGRGDNTPAREHLCFGCSREW
jgi:hypothetical protein